MVQGYAETGQNSNVFVPKACSNTQAKIDRFAGVSIDELLVIEVCAGSARLTKICRKLGIRGLAIDKIQKG